MGIVAVLISLVVPIGGSITNRWWTCAWNLLHLPAFFLLTRSLLYLVRKIDDSALRLFLTVMLAALVAVGSEFVQMNIGRSASFHDLVLDGVGIALGIFWSGQSDSRRRSRKAFFGILLLSAFAVAFAPTLLLERSEHRWSERLPVIGDFDDVDCRRLWNSQGRAEVRLDKDGGGLRITVRSGVFGGVNYLPGEQDWSSYSELMLMISNPGPPLHLGIRVDDHHSAEDRSWHSAETKIGEGDSTVVIPLVNTTRREGERTVDLSRTTRLVIFLAEVENPVEFLIISAVLR